MTAATVSVDASKPNVARRLFRGAKNLVIGTLTCATPPTAVLALGWMLRDMRAVAMRRISPPAAASADSVNWVRGPRASGMLSRWFGGVWLNTKSGVSGLIGLAIATLPFTGLWLLSWWAGWENSFNKGYEQSWVGPAVGLTGVAISLFILPQLPMALAHRAVEQRWLALFELKRIRQLIAHAGWRYVLLAAATVITALPLTGARGLPVFAEQIAPQLTDLPAAAWRELAQQIALVKAAYVFVVLVVLRRWAAAIYAVAAMRVAPNTTPTLWHGSVVGELIALQGDKPRPTYAPWRLGRMVRAILLAIFWFGLIAQLYVSQFLNHSWWLWLSHPFLVLPWLP